MPHRYHSPPHLASVEELWTIAMVTIRWTTSRSPAYGAPSTARRCALCESKSRQGAGRKEQGPLLVSAPPHLAPSAIRRGMKGCTARKRCEACPKRKKRSWGGHGWARGSGWATVGPMTAELGHECWAQHCAPARPDHFRTESERWVCDPYPAFQSFSLSLQLAAGGCLIVRIVTKRWSYGRCGIRNMGWCMMSSRRSKKGSMGQDVP